MPYYIQNVDCVDGLLTLDSRSIECVVTSCPWDDIFEYGGHSWDFERTAQHLYRVMVDGGVVCWEVRDQIVNGQITLTSHRQALFFLECGFRCHEQIVIEPNVKAKILGRYDFPPIMVYVFSKGKPRCFNPICDRPNLPDSVGLPYRRTQRNYDGSREQRVGSIIRAYGKRHNIWRVRNGRNDHEYLLAHPARMQESLARDLIISYSNYGNTILDPFAGVATTCKMALLNGRHYIGFEIHTPYYVIAQRRMKEAWDEYLSL
jgi:DNA modification methylase